MRINKYIAQSTSLSRRAADTAIEQGRVTINGLAPSSGQQVSETDAIMLDGHRLTPASNTVTIMLNKPTNYICSRNGQGSRTIYDLLPERYLALKSIGRLDKQSSGLLLLTNDGELANQLTHPSYSKLKLYEITLDKPLQPLHHQIINDRGIQLEDGSSKLGLMKLDDEGLRWQVTMREGRNRQIRRTLQALGYRVTSLHRTQFGDYHLGNLQLAGVSEI